MSFVCLCCIRYVILDKWLNIFESVIYIMKIKEFRCRGYFEDYIKYQVQSILPDT